MVTLFFDVDELDIVCATINDVNLLGSAIFSRWRGLTYWSFSPDEITHEVNRKWFGIAFRRLCDLESVFRGELKQVQIFSHELKSVITPVLDEVIEQDIIINSEGAVTFTECTFEEKYQMKNDGKTSEFTIEKEKSVMLLNKLAKAFTYVPELLLSSDAGHWQVKLVNLEDEEYFYTGCFGDNEFINTVELSNEVRNTINKSNLYAFDGNYKYDSITRINVNYTRSTTVPDVSSKDAQNTPVIEYTETILVDRASETVEHTMKYSTNRNFYQKYTALGEISKLLDSLYSNNFLINVEGNPKDVLDTLGDLTEYTITMDYKNNPQQIISGTFDKKSLPSDYGNFAQQILLVINQCKFSEVLDLALYNKSRRCESDYITAVCDLIIVVRNITT